nr:MAG TPA: hypothetical protein [Caudoviricetes sp.]
MLDFHTLFPLSFVFLLYIVSCYFFYTIYCVFYSIVV